MRTTRQPIDYMTKDYEGFRQMMIDLIPTHTPEWTDHSQSDMGIVLLELLANGLDILSYYQDKAVNESFLPTAKTRRAVINLCRLLGYELRTQLPARHEIVVTKSDEFLNTPVTIPRGTKVSTDPDSGSPVVFETETELIITAGQSSGTVIASHGVTVDSDVVGSGDNTANQKFALTYQDVIKDSLVVTTVESGVSRQWSIVDDFLNSNSSDRHFTAYMDEFGRTTIEFGNGISGRKIPSPSPVIGNYRVGGGIIGNVGKNTINKFIDTEITGVSSITNPNDPIVYGVDKEDIESAKIVAPRSYRTLGRAVTKMDFEDIASSYPGVGKSKCVETFNANGDLNIYISTPNYSLPSPELKSGLLSKLQEVKLIHDNPIILNATYKTVNFTVDVTVFPNFLNSDVQARAEDTIRNVLRYDMVDFGETIILAYLVKELMMLPGVKNATITSPTADVTTLPNEVFKLGTLTVNVTGGESYA